MYTLYDGVSNTLAIIWAQFYQIPKKGTFGKHHFLLLYPNNFASRDLAGKKLRTLVKTVKMAQWIKALTAKPENLDLISKTYMVEGEKWLLHMVPWLLLVCLCFRPHGHRDRPKEIHRPRETPLRDWQDKWILWLKGQVMNDLLIYLIRARCYISSCWPFWLRCS